MKEHASHDSHGDDDLVQEKLVESIHLVRYESSARKLENLENIRPSPHHNYTQTHQSVSRRGVKNVTWLKNVIF